MKGCKAEREHTLECFLQLMLLKPLQSGLCVVWLVCLFYGWTVLIGSKENENIA